MPPLTFDRLNTKLETVFVKHYAPNHMPDTKGELSLLENINEDNSKLHQSIYFSSLISRQRYKSLSQIHVLQIFCSHACSYAKFLCLKRGITQPKTYRIGSKVKQFIHTLICYYTPNIRILAKAVLQIFCSQGCSYIFEKGA